MIRAKLNRGECPCCGSSGLGSRGFGGFGGIGIVHHLMNENFESDIFCDFLGKSHEWLIHDRKEWVDKVMESAELAEFMSRQENAF